MAMATVSTAMMTGVACVSYSAPAGSIRVLPARPALSAVPNSVQSLRGQTLRTSTPGAAAAGRAIRMPVLAMDADDEDTKKKGGRRGRDGGDGKEGGRRGPPGAAESDGFDEQVVQVRRVTKVVKGGKQISFRAVVVVGDRKGQVGVGCASAKEVVNAVQKAAILARQEKIKVPITRGESFPHPITGRHGAARVMLRPAAEGSGVSAGGATRAVMELAGIRNGFGKQLGGDNPLNNARATIKGLSELRTWQQVADSRGVTVPFLMGLVPLGAKSCLSLFQIPSILMATAALCFYLDPLRPACEFCIKAGIFFSSFRAEMIPSNSLPCSPIPQSPRPKKLCNQLDSSFFQCVMAEKNGKVGDAVAAIPTHENHRTINAKMQLADPLVTPASQDRCMSNLIPPYSTRDATFCEAH